MIKSKRGGRRATVATQQTTAQQTTAQTQQTPQVQQQNTPIVQPANGQFIQLDSATAQQLRNNADSYYTSDVSDARKQYISKTTDSNGYSFSQNLNYKLDNNLPLNATEKFIDKNLAKGMHDLGINAQLTRAAHDDMLKDLGIKDYTTMTIPQLKKALVGGVYTTKSYNSFGYDDSINPFIGGSQSGGRELIIKANAPSGTKVVFGNKQQGEIITNKGTNYRIDNISYSGKTVTPRTGGSKKQIILEVTIV